MSLRHEILGLLYYNAATGYELTKLINTDGLFFWQAQQSQVYREIVKLENEGKIEPGEESTEHKKVYVPTESGISELKEWLEQKDTLSSVEIRNPLVMRLFFGNLADHKKTLEMVKEYKAESQRMLEQIAAQQQDINSMAFEKQDNVFFALSSFYGVGFYNFSIEWADKCIAILEKLQG